MYDSWVGSSTIVEGDFRPVLQIGKYHNRKVLESKGCAHARAHGTRAMNGGRQVHYFFLVSQRPLPFAATNYRGRRARALENFRACFFFNVFFITISFTSFFCQILGLFAQSGLRENSKVNMQKRSRIFWQLFFVVV